MARHFKVEDLITDADRPEAIRNALHRATTIDQLCVWLRARGYKVSRGAVHNWRRHLVARHSDPRQHLLAQIADKLNTMDAEQLANVVKQLEVAGA